MRCVVRRRGLGCVLLLAVGVAAIILISLGAMSLSVSGATRYVTEAGAGLKDGSSWENAHAGVQAALTAAVSGDELWVAAGTYTPTAGTDRTATFQLKNGVALYGGFAGGESSLGQRDWENNKTILGGDLNEDDGPSWANRGDNSYHVVTGSGTDATAVLDGFTVRGGYATGGGDDNFGGGMYNDNGSPTVAGCTFSGNWAAEDGGGMYNRAGSNPTVTGCTFSGNKASDGGGIFNSISSPTLINCTFSDNFARGYGGGMCNWKCSPTVQDCTFSGNGATSGGGMYNEEGGYTMTVRNCTFSGNFAHYSGGGMYNDHSSPTMTNCTFSDNEAAYGGGMYSGLDCWPNVTNCTFSGNEATYDGGGMFNVLSCLTVTNCTFSGNGATSGGGMFNAECYSGYPTVKNTILAGNTGGDCAGDGPTSLGYNLDSDGSCFTDGVNNDMTRPDPLLGPLQDNGGATLTHALLPGSPAIDAIPSPNNYNGAPDTDQRGFPRPQGTHCDIGAFEQEVSKGDTTGDGSWDLLDVVLCQQMASGLVHGTAAQRAAADVDDDGDVDADDVTILSEYVLGIRTTLP
ncbi:choice-of-anchor Q domain-containing protein [Candidatus Bipolaricaulota bacterium]